MPDKFEVGRLFGIPVLIDVSFVLLFVLFGYQHLSSASIGGISYGIVLVTGVALSVLLHELGHALAARYWNVPTAYVELNGLGGLCHFARPMPVARIPNIVMLLAGPAANLILWQACALAAQVMLSGDVASHDYSPSRAAFLLMELGRINFMLFVFNLMPAHPLDGGRALAQVLSAGIGTDRAMRVVAYMGLVVAAWLALLAFKGAFFAALIAFVLLQANLSVLRTYKGPPWRRWN